MNRDQLYAMNIHYRYYDLEYFFRACQKMNLKHAELWLCPQHFYINSMWSESPEKLKGLMKRSGVQISCICPEQNNPKPNNIAARSELLIENTRKYFQNVIILASELGCDKIIVTPGWNYHDEEVDEELTRENLINKLIEYKKYKELTPTFKKLEEDRKNIYIKSPEKVSEYTDNHEYGVLSSNDLLEAFKKFLERKEKEKPLNTTVTNKEYSVRDRKKSIRNILHNKRKAYLEEFIEEYNRPYLVVTFLGILEMVKEKEVIIKQDKNFDKILVELR